MIKKIGLIVFTIFLISFVSASDGFIFEQDQDADVKIRCFDINNSACQGSSCQFSLDAPDGDNLVNNASMTDSNTYFNYTIDGSNLSELGDYSAWVTCQGNTDGFSSFPIEVTPLGFSLTEGSASIYVIMIVIILVIFIILLYYGLTLKWENQLVPDDNYVYIDYKKYLKIILLFGAYLTLTFMFVIAKGMANAFLYSTEAYAFFDLALKFALIGIVPTFILTFVFIVIGALSDKKIHDAVTRGLPVR